MTSPLSLYVYRNICFQLNNVMEKHTLVDDRVNVDVGVVENKLEE